MKGRLFYTLPRVKNILNLTLPFRYSGNLEVDPGEFTIQRAYRSLKSEVYNPPTMNYRQNCSVIYVFRVL